jgi:hypothetical protein
VTGNPAMISNSCFKIARCIGSNLSSADDGGFFVFGAENHLAHVLNAPLLEEHMFGAAQANTFRAEHSRRRASSGVSAFARTPMRRASSAQPMMVAKSPESSGWILALHRA